MSPRARRLLVAAVIAALVTPVAAPGNQALWDNIGADGQTGISRTGGASNETTTIRYR